MCGNNSCVWIILILIILFSCCGNGFGSWGGNWGGNGGCGCEQNTCGCC